MTTHHGTYQAEMATSGEAQAIVVCKVPQSVCEIGDRKQYRPDQKAEKAGEREKPCDVELDEFIARRPVHHRKAEIDAGD